MGKTKKKQSSAAHVDSSEGIDNELGSVVRCHREFFDRLIELIPSKFYLPNDEESRPWYQGLSKAAKASLKQKSKENLKLARRRRFDPDSKLPPLELVAGEEGNVEREEGVDLVGQNKENAATTYEELRQKLRRKIEDMRGNRGGSCEKRSDSTSAKNEAKKRKRDSVNAGVDLKEGENGEEVIEYGKVRLDGDDEGNSRKKKKGKVSKAKELERAQRLQEAKKQKPGIVDRESWKAATSRAMGLKVHNDVRLIKESMKREKRKKEKNAEKWKERVESQEKIKEKRQQKRKDNIAGRIQEKKMRKIAKREKKLMRPGFEGRKSTYITQE